MNWKMAICRSLFALLVLSSASASLFTGRCDALALEYQAAFQQAALEIFYQKPIYALGGNLEQGKTDCSGFVWQAFRRGGVPVIQNKRPQAWIIYRGGHGFIGKSLDWMRDDFQAETADLLCLRVSSSSLQRPFGINHVGAVILWRGVYQVIDANSRTKGIRIGPFSGIWRKWLPKDGYRRLTIGDAKW